MSALTRSAVAVAGLALALGLSACSGGSTSGSPGGYGAPADEAPAEEAPAEEAPMDGAAALAVASSELGEIVVDGEGLTVYMFDDDEQGAGASTCAGQCLDNWPPVTAGSDDVALEGVTGEVTTFEGPDGAMQVALNGWPLYYFAGDAGAGDTAGQAVNDVWWVLTPAGEPIRE
ncbi:COG4315 family predicted lipoprotein [Microbacterium halophytorum]|uniref:COG4315 family predicted lipoprotein n=1 Tax=Microbacterium halophytorum TaxID=2067568 RepID=UPI000CFCBF89|nr:hypothetical protein [Microbacterium halophytorum]